MAIPKSPDRTEGKGPETSTPEAFGNATENSPEWLGNLNELLNRIDPKDAEKAIRDIEGFVDGDMTWAEVQGIPQQLLFDIAERGYLKFKSGRLQEAESLFKGLSMVDHKTAYYYTALGAIYQKQENLLDAISAYTVAIELDPEDITAYVNRGEVYSSMGIQEQPLQDFDAAIKLDPEGKDPWANRARFLKKRILEDIAESKAASSTEKKS
jgi:tetratricopeptide (TPR) repeat protein